MTTCTSIGLAGSGGGGGGVRGPPLFLFFTTVIPPSGGGGGGGFFCFTTVRFDDVPSLPAVCLDDTDRLGLAFGPLLDAVRVGGGSEPAGSIGSIDADGSSHCVESGPPCPRKFISDDTVSVLGIRLVSMTWSTCLREGLSLCMDDTEDL